MHEAIKAIDEKLSEEDEVFITFVDAVTLEEICAGRAGGGKAHIELVVRL